MKTWLATGTAFAVLGLMASAPASAVDLTAADDPILFWNQVVVKNYTVPGASPVTTSRGVAMVEVALHDAINSALGNPNKSYLTGVSTPGGDARAAAAQAAHDVLISLTPSSNMTAINNINQALADSLDKVTSSAAAKSDGVATGAAIATAVINGRAGDGWNAVPPAPPGTPPDAGKWGSTATNGVGRLWGEVEPWLIHSAQDYLAPAAPDIHTPEYRAALEEVIALRATDGSDEAQSAKFWAQASGAGPWIQAAIDVASQMSGRTTVDNATMMAQLGVGVADTTIALFYSKYFYDYWRPFQAIHRADEVLELEDLDDDSWAPYIPTPNHPSYISGHSAQAALAATILAANLGDDHSFELSWSGAAYGSLDRDWGSFSDAAEDAAMSRLWGGIHYRFDNVQGQAVGRSVGQYVLAQNVFQPVPEPASWAMMIAGFGAVGYSLRRRSRVGRLQAV